MRLVKGFRVDLDSEFLEGADVVHNDVHQPHLVREAHEEMQPRWVEGDRGSGVGVRVQGYLAYKNTRPPRTLP